VADVSYEAAVLADNPTGYWRFEETSGTSAADSSGNGHTATVNGANLDVEGAVGSGVGFDGVDDRVVLGILNTNNALPGWTWEVWVNVQHSANTNQGIIGEHTHGFRRTLLRQTTQASSWTLQIVLDIGTDVFTARTVAGLPYDTTMHLAVTFENAQTSNPIIRVYRDGTQVASFSNIGAPLRSPWQQQNLGTRDSSNHLFLGMMDEAAFYTYPLSAARVEAHYDATSAPPTPDPPTGLTVVQEGSGLRASWTSDADEFVLRRERWIGPGEPT